MQSGVLWSLHLMELNNPSTKEEPQHQTKSQQFSCTWRHCFEDTKVNILDGKGGCFERGKNWENFSQHEAEVWGISCLVPCAIMFWHICLGDLGPFHTCHTWTVTIAPASEPHRDHVTLTEHFVNHCTVIYICSHDTLPNFLPHLWGSQLTNNLSFPSAARREDANQTSIFKKGDFVSVPMWFQWDFTSFKMRAYLWEDLLCMVQGCSIITCQTSLHWFMWSICLCGLDYCLLSTLVPLIRCRPRQKKILILHKNTNNLT